MEQAKEWLVYMLVGFISGTVAFCMITTEEFLLDMQVLVIQTVLRGSCTPSTNLGHENLIDCL